MPLVRTEDRGAVRHVLLARPEKRNALNDELIGDLHAALQAVATDDAIRVVVLRGDGPMFSSGVDLGGLGELAASPEKLDAFRAPILETWNLLETMPKATIAALHGACIGGALELALAADLRVAAEGTVMGLPETRIGLLPDVGGSTRLPAVVGLGNAKELIMTSKLIDAAEAHRIGLVNRVGADLDALVDGLAEELLACAPVAISMAKRVMDAAAKPTLAASLEAEGIAQAVCGRTADFAEGVRAVVEKRAPQFTGR